MRRAIASGAAILAVLAVLVVHPSGILVSELPEGVSVNTVNGRAIFIDKEGLVLTALDARDAAGTAIWWCPSESFYVDPATSTAYDPSGHWVAGPSRGGLRAYPVKIDAGYRIHVADRPETSATQGSAPGPSLAAFRLWALDRRAHFCANPLHA